MRMERIDDLQWNGLVLLQDDETACFSQDATLLCAFLRLKKSDRVVDLGCGNGILCVLGQGTTGASFTGVDKQQRLIELARRSAQRNGQDIRFETADVSDAPALLGHGAFTAAVCNPPYFTAGDESKNASRAAARHGRDALDLFLRAAFLLLKNGGRLFLCFPTERLCDALAQLKACRLEPKRMQLVAASPEKAPHLALIESKKLAKPGLRLEPVKFLRA